MDVFYIYFFHFFFFKMCSAEMGEVEVVVRKLQPEDLDENFMKRNGISKICGVKCRTDLEQTIQSILVTVKGSFLCWQIRYVACS